MYYFAADVALTFFLSVGSTSLAVPDALLVRSSVGFALLSTPQSLLFLTSETL